MLRKLIFAFFLLIFFIAVAAQLPARAPVASTPVPAAAPAPVPAPVVPERPVLSKAQQILEKLGLDAKMETRGLVISLPQTVLFASGDDRITDSALPIVEEIAEVLRDVPNKVTLIGHADSIPIHNRRFKNNWELSAARAAWIVRYLIQNYQLDPTAIEVSGYAEFHPIESNSTEGGRAKNRRVEILVLAHSSGIN